MPKVLITTEALRHLPGTHVDMLRSAGLDVEYPVRPVLLTEAETAEAMAGCVAVIAGSEPYTADVLTKLPELRVISRNGVGYDRIDVPAATRRGVVVAITPEGNHQAVAEHAMALMLAVARRIVTSACDTRQGKWARRSTFIPLRGRTLGIIGLGRIGRSMAIRAAAFGMRIVAHEQMPDLAFAQRHEIELVDLDTLLSRSDFVTLHAPMTPATAELINRDTIEHMKQGSVLINTARGGLVNEAALVAALESGHLAGAGLDVLAIEPPAADHPLLSLETVVVTPHVAALDAQAVVDMADGAAANIVELLAGRWPAAALVNPEVREHWGQ